MSNDPQNPLSAEEAQEALGNIGLSLPAEYKVTRGLLAQVHELAGEHKNQTPVDELVGALMSAVMNLEARIIALEGDDRSA